MRRIWMFLTTILGCSFVAVAAILPAEEPAPAPPAARRRAEPSKDERRSPAQAFAHQLDMLRERQARQPVVPHAKNHESIRKAFRDSLRPVRAGTVTVLDGDEQVAAGTVVAPEGLVLTKSSELRGRPTVRLADGSKHAAEVVGVSEQHDLALLRIDRADLQPVTWAKAEPALGSWLATAGGGDLPVAVGVVSVASRPIRSRVLLGIALRPEADKAIVDKVFPGSTAAKIGLQPNDVVTRIANREIVAPGTVVELLRDRQPGEDVQIAVRRGEETLEFTARLEADGGLGPQRQERNEHMNILAGDLSARRGSFPQALQHDTVLKPEECGGPLVNLDGEAVGINISRAGRIESYALTPALILPLLEEMKSGRHPPDGKFPHLLEGRAIDFRIARQEKMLRAAERAETAAERKRADAEKALEEARRKRREWAERAP